MSLSSLALYTPGSQVSLNRTELIELLGSIELTGKPLEPSQFLAGPRFFHHITFLGCSPNIPILPEQGPHYIRITIPPLVKPELFAGQQAPAPLCPDCKQAFENWQQHIKYAENGGISCLHCRTTTPIDHLNFRKRACYSQNVIRIEPIFENEALPANGLLDTLGKAFDTHFSYAYIATPISLRQAPPVFQ